MSTISENSGPMAGTFNRCAGYIRQGQAEAARAEAGGVRAAAGAATQKNAGAEHKALVSSAGYKALSMDQRKSVLDGIRKHGSTREAYKAYSDVVNDKGFRSLRGAHKDVVIHKLSGAGSGLPAMAKNYKTLINDRGFTNASIRTKGRVLTDPNRYAKLTMSKLTPKESERLPTPGQFDAWNKSYLDRESKNLPVSVDYLPISKEAARKKRRELLAKETKDLRAHRDEIERRWFEPAAGKKSMTVGEYYTGHARRSTWQAALFGINRAEGSFWRSKFGVTFKDSPAGGGSY